MAKSQRQQICLISIIASVINKQKKGNYQKFSANKFSHNNNCNPFQSFSGLFIRSLIPFIFCVILPSFLVLSAYIYVSLSLWVCERFLLFEFSKIPLHISFKARPGGAYHSLSTVFE